MKKGIGASKGYAIGYAFIKKDEEVKREKVANETNAGDKPQTVKGKGAVGKNALCPCGSGKKYKRCCGKDLD